MGRLGALSGQGDILNSNQAQSSVLCSVTTRSAVLLAICISQQPVFSTPIFQNLIFCNQLYVQSVRGGTFIRLNYIDVTKNLYIQS